MEALIESADLKRARVPLKWYSFNPKPVVPEPLDLVRPSISPLWFVGLIAFIALRLVFWLKAFPNSDEAYYWLWGQHLQWSYYDHPPLQAWVQGAFAAWLGRSEFVLRLPNLFTNIIFFYTYYCIAAYLYPKQTPKRFWLSVLLVLASPLYFVFLGLAWHDHLLITFSLVSAYQFTRFADGVIANGRGETGHLYFAAGAIALAGLSKYNAIFVVFGFFATIVVVPGLRRLLVDRRLYIAAIIAMSALIPIVVWNYSNDFQSLQYYVNRSVNPVAGGIKIGACLGFLGASYFLVSPFYWNGFFRVLRNRTRLKEITSVYPIVAFWIFLISSVILTIVSLISAALYYWNITAYILLFPLLPFVFSKRPPLSALLYGLLISSLVVIHYTVLPLSAFLDQSVDPDSRMLFGWREVASEVTKQAKNLGEPPLLITTDYRSASALAYELNNKDVIAVSDRIDQFDFWHPDREKLQGKNAVIVWDDWHPATGKLLPKFDRVSEPITVPVTRFGILLKNYYIQKGYWYKP
ncbi:ArnT family glycosyltransferase [Myxacorys almedinensis]|uniref:4-amino-4-deoxy-L-arabinose transferase n=1 Tax=Myxacorys almedinensis A TaxID=2690445 RepID=A0A8J7Z6G5_9CYAN|nr:glycosyltransferase family 39 protein [Myxacorys almedinensis]NDJ18938.1 4-amino-4-deoxy-L-arabinose transferase [Myxacorys almedinensis A]